METALERARRLSAELRDGNIRLNKKGNPVRVPAPNPHEQAILRRIARGHLLRTMIDGWPRFAYEDGTPVGRRNSDPFSQKDLARFVRNGWIVGDRDGMFDNLDPLGCQVYRVPRLSLQKQPAQD